jgi:hypothetical protein
MLTSGTYSGIKGVQRGTITIPSGSGSASATITAVNTAKTELRFLGTVQAASSTDYLARVFLTNATTVTAYRSNTTIIGTDVSWELTEWN